MLNIVTAKLSVHCSVSNDCLDCYLQSQETFLSVKWYLRYINFTTIQIAMANSTDLQVEDFEEVPMVATLAFSWLKRTHLQPSNGRNV